MLRCCTESGSNGSGLSLQVWVWVINKPFPNWPAWWIAPNRQFRFSWMKINIPSALGRLSAGCPPGAYGDSYNAPVFSAWKLYFAKTAYSTPNNHVLHISQFANFDYFAIDNSPSTCCIFSYEAVYTSVISFDKCITPWLPSIQCQRLLTLSWYSFSWKGDKVLRMGKWLCGIQFWLQRLPIGQLCITANK